MLLITILKNIAVFYFFRTVCKKSYNPTGFHALEKGVAINIISRLLSYASMAMTEKVFPDSEVQGRFGHS